MWISFDLNFIKIFVFFYFFNFNWISYIFIGHSNNTPDQLLTLAMKLFEKAVDVTQKFHLTLINVCFSNLVEEGASSAAKKGICPSWPKTVWIYHMIMWYWPGYLNGIFLTDEDLSSESDISDTRRESDITCFRQWWYFSNFPKNFQTSLP